MLTYIIFATCEQVHDTQHAYIHTYTNTHKSCPLARVLRVQTFAQTWGLVLIYLKSVENRPHPVCPQTAQKISETYHK